MALVSRERKERMKTKVTNYDGEYNYTKQKKNGPGALAVVAVILIAVLGGVVGSWIYDSWFREDVTREVVIQQAEPSVTQDQAYSTPVAAVAATAGPTVVEITTEAKATHPFLGSYVTSGAGSGVIMSPDGYIVTNDHVVSGADSLSVRTQAGDVLEASLIGTDTASDLAVIKVEAEGLPAAIFANSDTVIVGETAIAIGNPLGTLGGTISEGIISAKERNITIGGEAMLLIQTTAAINPGNSGGGLFNSQGLLVGIVNAKSSGEDIEGIGFAIPFNTVQHVARQLIEQGA